MVLTARALALAAPFTILLLSTTITASPLGGEDGSIDASMFGIHRRQDPGPSGTDPSGIQPEDEDDAEIAADGTGPLRSAVSARPLYTNQPTATWYQISSASGSDASASFTVFTTTTPEVTPIPAPDDPNQIQGGAPWNVDHIFELQVIGECFKGNRPNNIPAADWASASSAVFTSGPQNSAIASAVTNLNNLKGIPNAVNSFKKQVFTQNLTGVGGPSQGNSARYFNFFGPAVLKYLTDNQAALMAGTVDDTGDELQAAGNGNVDVKNYFTNYASTAYQGCIDYLSTSWTGKALPPTSSTFAAATSTTAGAASVTCYHEADPDNTCAAIADGPGWCECDDSPTTYAIMPSPAPQPCAWTTTPPTTSFDCAATPTSCDVPDGCTNVAAPTGCAVECT